MDNLSFDVSAKTITKILARYKQPTRGHMGYRPEGLHWARTPEALATILHQSILEYLSDRKRNIAPAAIRDDLLELQASLKAMETILIGVDGMSHDLWFLLGRDMGLGAARQNAFPAIKTMQARTAEALKRIRRKQGPKKNPKSGDLARLRFTLALCEVWELLGNNVKSPVGGGTEAVNHSEPNDFGGFLLEIGSLVPDLPEKHNTPGAWQGQIKKVQALKKQQPTYNGWMFLDRF